MSLSLPAFLSRKAPPLLGVDISASGVKLVELARGQKTALRLACYAIEPLPRGVIVDGNFDRPEAVADALSRGLKRLGSRTRDVAIALPAAAVITKRISLPAGLSEEEYELQVESEASQYIPFAIEEVNLDFQILGPSGRDADSGEVEVLLAASRKEQVEDRVAVAEMAGLRAVVMDVEPYAQRAVLDHAMSRLPNGGQGEIVAVFDIGATVTRLTIVLNGATVFEREQAFGGIQLTQDIVRLYGLTPEEAEARKRSGDLPDNYHAELVRPFVDQGATDIGRALQFFFTSTPYSRVDRIYITGGSAVVPGLAEAIGERTEARTEVLSPFDGMETASSVRDRQLRADAPSLMVAAGLAMRRFDA